MWETFNQFSHVMKNFLKIFGILVLGIFALSFTQTRIITGKVTDLSGNPLPGVVIQAVPSSGSSSVSASDGTYRINIGQETRKLVFTLTGYTTKEVTVGKINVINVKLEPVAMIAAEMAVADKKSESRTAMPSYYVATRQS